MKINSQATQDKLNAELAQAEDGRVPGPEVYESILREVVERADADPKLSYAAGLERVESIRRRARRRRNGTLIGIGCAAVAACFGLYFTPISPANLYSAPSGEELVVIEDSAPPLAALPEGIGGAHDIRVEFVDSVDGRLTLCLSGFPDSINWQSAYGVDPDGVMYFPVRIDPQKGLVTFDHPDNNLTVHVRDADGNALL